MAFRVGQQVVCVDAKDYRAWLFWVPFNLEQDAIYTVAGFGRPSVTFPDSGTIIVAGQPNVPYASRRFRPLVDLSDFHAICNEVKQGNPRKITEVNPLDKRPVKVA